MHSPGYLAYTPWCKGAGEPHRCLNDGSLEGLLAMGARVSRYFQKFQDAYYSQHQCRVVRKSSVPPTFGLSSWKALLLPLFNNSVYGSMPRLVSIHFEDIQITV